MTINKQKAINKIHLEDTKVFIDIEIISKKTLKIPYKTFIKKLDKFLIKFTDPVEEIKEACDLAFKKGFVIIAKFENKIVGFSILNKMNFKYFFPKYHLSYLAVNSDFKGHGLATLLLERAILLSKPQFQVF